MKAKDILTDESKWTRGTQARDRRGMPCDPRSKRAVQFCLVGAIFRVYRGWEERHRAFDAIWHVIGPTKPIEYWNDDPSRTFADVLEALEKADI
jgi:hypothetical protein